MYFKNFGKVSKDHEESCWCASSSTWVVLHQYHPRLCHCWGNEVSDAYPTLMVVRLYWEIPESEILSHGTAAPELVHLLASDADVALVGENQLAEMERQV